ncbi:MAG: hypothetical protein HQK53_07765 [Oligoflexia bacterium]|nr:hypothetical protein [Oligoflexia bacterium]
MNFMKNFILTTGFLLPLVNSSILMSSNASASEANDYSSMKAQQNINGDSEDKQSNRGKELLRLLQQADDANRLQTLSLEKLQALRVMVIQAQNQLRDQWPIIVGGDVKGEQLVEIQLQRLKQLAPWQHWEQRLVALMGEDPTELPLIMRLIDEDQ